MHISTLLKTFQTIGKQEKETGSATKKTDSKRESTSPLKLDRRGTVHPAV